MNCNSCSSFRPFSQYMFCRYYVAFCILHTAQAGSGPTSKTMMMPRMCHSIHVFVVVFFCPQRFKVIMFDTLEAERNVDRKLVKSIIITLQKIRKNPNVVSWWTQGSTQKNLTRIQGPVESELCAVQRSGAAMKTTETLAADLNLTQSLLVLRGCISSQYLPCFGQERI